jgi:hypothetical protein
MGQAMKRHRRRPAAVVVLRETPLFRRSAVAAAVGLAVSAPIVLADGWGRNLQVFVNPGSERDVYGGALLQPIWQNSTSLFYGDMRGNFARPTDTEELNFGLGYRYVGGPNGWVLGGWASADVRDSRRNNIYSQVSWGAEALGPVWDARLNFYYPLTDEKRVRPWPTGGFFQGNRLFTSTVMEEALRGLDAEVGLLLPVDFAETRFYIGGHHFDGDVAPDTSGAKVRVELRPLQSLVLGLSYEYDEEFENEAFFQIKYEFGYPFKRERRKQRDRMIQFAERDVDIRVTDTLPDYKMLSATPDNRTLLHSNVVHIDNTAAAGGDGSAERPYNNFAACFAARCMQNGALVYIHAGDGTATNYDQTFNLVDNQRLIGQGFNLYGIGGDMFPMITPGAGNGIVLANNNEVAGLNLANVPGDGLMGLNVTDFDIHDNLIEAQGDGIVIQTQADATYGSQMSAGSITANRVSSIGAVGTGIDITNIARDGLTATQTVDVKGNTVSTTGDFVYGVTTYNLASDDTSQATQTVTLAAATISTTGSGTEGVSNRNVALNDSARATQTVMLADMTVSTTGVYAGGVSNSNRAQYDSAQATQTVMLRSITIGTAGNGASGVSNSNIAYNDSAQATQTISLASHSISTTGVYAVGLSNMNQGFSDSARATQTVSLASSTISTTGDFAAGVANSNAGVFDSARATQTMTLADTAISATGERSTGVFNTNQGYGDSAQGAQIVALASSTISTAGNYGIGVLNINRSVAGNAQGIQTVALRDDTISATGDLAAGVFNYNRAINDNTHATQTLSLETNTISTAGNGVAGPFRSDAIVNDNLASGGSARATQAATLADNTVSATGTAADGISNLNRADNDTVQATQTTDLSPGANQIASAQAYGVRAENTNAAAPPGFATQLLDLTGATISAALGNIVAMGDPTQTIIGP